jgi:flagellar protein FlgJ
MEKARNVWAEFLPYRERGSGLLEGPPSGGSWLDWVPRGYGNSLLATGSNGYWPQTIQKGLSNSIDVKSRPTASGAPAPGYKPPASTGSAYRVSDITSQPDTSSREAFVKSLLPIAKAYEAATGIPAAAFIAVAAHESNWGKAGGNMLFGIKGTGLTAPTWEVENGKRVNITDSFQTYATPEDAFKGFVDLVSTGRYAPAWQTFQKTKNWKQFFRDINRAGYATDPIWGDKIALFTEGQIVPLINQLEEPEMLPAH